MYDNPLSANRVCIAVFSTFCLFLKPDNLTEEWQLHLTDYSIFCDLIYTNASKFYPLKVVSRGHYPWTQNVAYIMNRITIIISKPNMSITNVPHVDFTALGHNTIKVQEIDMHAADSLYRYRLIWKWDLNQQLKWKAIWWIESFIYII